jgi:hypothetical protein
MCKKDCGTRGRHTCDHRFKDGKAYKQLHYRPIIPLIYDLLAQSKFYYYLNYGRMHRSESDYSDFMDGEIARAHLKDMNKIAKEWVDMDPENRNSYIPINLLFSEFYDSGQLFKSYAFDFWPLLFQILNLPATLRGKIGLSYFLTALYCGKHTAAEKMLFTDLVCEELRCLYEGIKYEVDGQKYFIQARLVMHILDTKAAEPCMGYQSQSNSNFGCSFCGGITGIHNGSKCVFLGHRNYLPQLHYLRFFGQTGYCCPAGFYDHEKKRQWFVEEKFHNVDIDPKGFKYETFFADAWDVVCRIITRKKALIAENATITMQRNAVDAMMSMPANQRDRY